MTNWETIGSLLGVDRAAVIPTHIRPMTSSPYDSEFADYGSVFDEDGHRRLADAFHELPCAALMVVGRTALTMELYGGDVIGE